MENLNLILWVFSGLFGLCCGSFFNVCIYRLPRQGLHLSRPIYSFCPHCFTTLKWYENLPLLSYFFQRGQCRHCAIWISLRYPFVELLTAFFFVYMTGRFGQYPHPQWGVLIVYLIFTSALLVCSFIDMDLRIIPDEIDKPGMIIAPLLVLAVPQIISKSDFLPLPFGGPAFLSPLRFQAFVASLAGVLVGAGLVFVVGLVGKALFQKEAMGFGDVKFMGMIGGFLGYKTVGMAFLLACFLGAIVGISKKVFTKDPYLPFGPYLSLGALGMLLFRREIFHLVFTDYPRWIRGLLG